MSIFMQLTPEDREGIYRALFLMQQAMEKVPSGGIQDTTIEQHQQIDNYCFMMNSGLRAVGYNDFTFPMDQNVWPPYWYEDSRPVTKYIWENY